MMAPGTWDAVEKVRAAAAHMREMSANLRGGPFLLDAIAAMLEAETNSKHHRQGSHHRGILGGYSVMCSCGSQSIEPDGVAKPCDRLLRLLAVAEAYMPSGAS